MTDTSFRTFNTNPYDIQKQPMFFGEHVNVARYDEQRHRVFERLTEKQQDFFWRPTEVNLNKDRVQAKKAGKIRMHIFFSNLKYQTLLDSIQGRAPNIALLPVVSLAELETWIVTWAFSETIHSRSYTHIIRNMVPEPDKIFSDIVVNEEIRKRAVLVTGYYDRFIAMVQLYQTHGEGNYRYRGDKIVVTMKTLKRALYLLLVNINALEALRFYVSFACSFSFAEQGIFTGNANILQLIARDEALHMVGTQTMLQLMQTGQDDPDMKLIARESEDEAVFIFDTVATQEKDWARGELFKHGDTDGLNAEATCAYIDHLQYKRMVAAGFTPSLADTPTPFPWMNKYLDSSKLQVAPQETENTAYLTGALEGGVEEGDFADIILPSNWNKAA